MPEPAPERRSRLVDLSPLRESPAFARLWIGNSISAIGGQMTIVAVSLHIYQLTGSTFAVSLVAAFALIPTVVAGLWGGMLADAFDRRAILLIFAVLSWLSTAGIALVAWLAAEDTAAIAWLYGLTVLNAVGTTIVGTTRTSAYPRLLSAPRIPAAAALNGLAMGLAITVGPALAGVLVAGIGLAWTYTVDVLLYSAAFIGILSLPKLPPQGEVMRPGLASLIDGARFLRRAPNVRASFVIDIIAMTFGQPRVVFPAAGALAFGGGAVTVGALTAAFAVGTVLSSLFSGRVTGVRMQGRATARAVHAYGAFIGVFGIALLAAWWLRESSVLPAAGERIDLPGILLLGAGLLALAGAGAADNISAIFRQSILQTAAPDNMRGRLQGVFIVVVTGGPRVGDLYAGVLATVLAIWAPPLLGALVIAALVIVLMRTQRSFAAYDARDPQP